MKDDRTLGERVSDDVAHFGGSWWFIFSCAVLLLVWALWNIFMPWVFDPYPFILMNLFLSGLAIFQAPIILMAQNRAEQKQDIAYRNLFTEIKEMLEQDIQMENDIKKLSEEIKKNQEQHAVLLNFIKQVLIVQEENKRILEEIMQNQEEENGGEEALR